MSESQDDLVEALTLQQGVVGFLFDPPPSRRVVMVWKSKPDWQRHNWNGIGGQVERGEAPIDAMHRETAEELLPGMRLSPAAKIPWERIGEVIFPETRYQLHVFRAVLPEDWPDTIDTQHRTPADEPVTWKFWDPMAVVALKNTRWLVEMARDPAIKSFSITADNVWAKRII